MESLAIMFSHPTVLRRSIIRIDIIAYWNHFEYPSVCNESIAKCNVKSSKLFKWLLGIGKMVYIPIFILFVFVYGYISWLFLFCFCCLNIILIRPGNKRKSIMGLSYFRSYMRKTIQIQIHINVPETVVNAIYSKHEIHRR